MKKKAFMPLFLCFCLLNLSNHVQASPSLFELFSPETSLLGMTDLTENFEIDSRPGRITLTNVSSKPMPLESLLLSFNLDQIQGISNVLGEPWLDWIPTAMNNPKIGYFQYQNNAKLPGGVLNPNDSIVFEFAPIPWSTSENPQNVKVSVKEFNAIQTKNSAAFLKNGSQFKLVLTNNSVAAYDLRGAMIEFTYSGERIHGVWGEPAISWKIEQDKNTVVLKAPFDEAPILYPDGSITIEFSGSGTVSLPELKILNPDPSVVAKSSSQSTATAKLAPPKLYVGYFQSWTEKWQREPSKTGLARLASYVNVVNLSYLKPDAEYHGSLDLTGTGLEYPPGGQTLKGAMALLRLRNPNTKVLISIGGDRYTNWQNLNETNIAAMVRDFGFDGVDIDYEPTHPGCLTGASGVACESDHEYIDVIERLRKVLPRPYILSVAAWSVGAFGQGTYINAQPQGAYTGLLVNPLRKVGQQLDLVNIMSSGVSQSFDPRQALLAYQSLFTGRIVLGLEAPPKEWGGHLLSTSEVRDLTQFVLQKNAAGMMIWSLQRQPVGAVNETNPSPEMISYEVCLILGLGNCTQSLFSSSLDPLNNIWVPIMSTSF